MISAEVSPFIDDMPGAFARADLLVCRSGASTVAEVTAAGKPAIFIPLPTAADDHQTRNAEALADAGAARLLPQSSKLAVNGWSRRSRRLLRDRARADQDGRRRRAILPIPTRRQRSRSWLPASLASEAAHAVA